MSDRSSFVAALREVERAQEAERLRPGAVHRISRRLDAELLQAELPSRRRTWIPMVSFAAGAALVLAVFTLGSGPDATLREAPPAVAPMHASWQVGGDNCHASSGDTEIVFDGRCRVVVPGPRLVFESRETARFRAVEHGVALDQGAAIFEVEPVPEGPARRVEVPGGTIEVLGTRFSVVVYNDGGHVDLLEGAIRFVGLDGNVHDVEPGERFHFSANTTFAVAATPSADELAGAPAGSSSIDETARLGDEELSPPLAAGELLAALAAELDQDLHARSNGSRSKASASTSSEELRRIVEQISDLRAKRQYRAAVSLLRGTLDERWDARTREVLSYELGTILSTQLPDRANACAHWAEHGKQFPAGRYARAIERAQQRLGCQP